MLPDKAVGYICSKKDKAKVINAAWGNDYICVTGGALKILP